MLVQDLLEADSSDYNWTKEISDSARQAQAIPQTYCIRDAKHKLVKSGISKENVTTVLSMMEKDRAIMKKHGRLYISKI